MNQVTNASLICRILISAFCSLAIVSSNCQANASMLPQETEAKASDTEGIAAPDSENGASTEENESPSATQSPTGNQLMNGSLENAIGQGTDGWSLSKVFQDGDFEFKSDDQAPFEGKLSGKLDSTNADVSENKFGVFRQTLNAEKFRGKRVRFKAAVRMAETTQGGKSQLWLRVDRKTEGGALKRGAFDNMADRPITGEQWKHYEIVADVAEDADVIIVGILLIGKAIAWIDDASLEIMSEQEKASTKVTGQTMASKASPAQPFFNGWLWLAGIALGLMVLSQQANSAVQRFALRFTLVYWLLYSFPTLITGLAGKMLVILAKFEVPVEGPIQWIARLTKYHEAYTAKAVYWTAANVFGIEGQLVLPGGSGDTTFSFIRIFACCAIALGVAVIWSGVYWRKADQTWLRDILRTYLRYVLALTMLGYGLHKTGFNMTQFAQDAMPNDYQMDRTYGESSPMGLLWTFMAASPAYTFFAGLGEVVGGLLLVFRRTATIGALVVFGVMLNVMMLNFCYDVPVKQYSFHLVMMALIVALPEFPRLFNLLVMNRVTEPGNLMTPPYTNRYTVWAPRLLKLVIVACAFAWPVAEQIFKEVKFYQTDSVRQREEQAESEHLLINRGFRWVNEVPYNR